MWEGEAAETDLPGLLEIYVNVTAANQCTKNPPHTSAMIFMLTVNLNPLLQGSCTIHLCFPLKS